MLPRAGSPRFQDLQYQNPTVVERAEPRPDRDHPVEQRLVSEQDPAVRVLHVAGQSFAAPRRIESDERSAGESAAEEREDELRAVLAQDADVERSSSLC